MGLISINGMRFYAHHGCFEQEQAIGTWFRVDLQMRCDTRPAEASDIIDDTVNYLDVYQAVKAEMAVPSHLLEHVARRIGERVLRNFAGVQWLKVIVHKFNPPLGGQMESVSVEVELER